MFIYNEKYLKLRTSYLDLIYINNMCTTYSSLTIHLEPYIIFSNLKIESLIKSGGGNRPFETRQPKSNNDLLFTVLNPTDLRNGLEDKRRNGKRF